MLRAALWTTLVAVSLAAGVARAGDPEADATALYERGSQLLREGKREEALVDLSRSMQLLPSPNTELLVAHALRELGRRVPAMRAYERVAADAGARVARGEDRFQPTLADATHWIGLLRGEIGEVRVVVERAPAGAVVSVDGEQLSIEGPRAGVVRARTWHDPGRALVEVRAPAGDKVSSATDVRAGAPSEVRLVFVPLGGKPPERAPAATGGGPPPATWVAGGIGLTGLALFAGFGARAWSIANDLDECAPHCPVSRRDDVDAGRAASNIANVSLAVAVSGLAVAAVAWWASPGEARQGRGGK